MKFFFLIFAIIFLSTSCSTQNVSQNLYDSVNSYHVYLPVAASAILQFDDWDKRMAKGLRSNTPVWGSQDRAHNASNTYRTASTVTMLASAFLVPCESGCYSFYLEQMLMDYATQASAIESRNLIKYNVKRSRPDGSPRSFPSGHTTAAAARVATGNLNIQRSFTGTSGKILQGVNWLIAYTVAYARIEARAHHPSDTLFAISWGYFVSNFVKRSFYQKRTQSWFAFYPSEDLKGGQVNFAYSF